MIGTVQNKAGSWLAQLGDVLGALPARQFSWGLVLVFSIWVLFDVFVLRLTGGLAQSSFDAMVRARLVVAAPDPRVVIVDIDEASLAKMGREFGRWPWPRDTLATVLDHIEGQQPAAVVWDVVFSDADRLSPGGDAAFNHAASRSAHSHFSVVRLPPANDAASMITSAVLPGLWVAHGARVSSLPDSAAATVALVPPALPAIAAGKLGYNNGYVDGDGVLRRYRYQEQLSDGKAIQSIPLSVLSSMAPAVYLSRTQRQATASDNADELIVWRSRANIYPRFSFAEVFAQAEGAKVSATLPSFAGKVVVIGATAPSLHDIHPTPLSASQAGVDTLATAIDNALNQRHLAELPRWLEAVLAMSLCAGLALWVQLKGAASLAPALLVLPILLLAMSYLSLNGLPVFLDLHLAAGLALVFLAVLRLWGNLRRRHWCTLTQKDSLDIALFSFAGAQAWTDSSLDRLMDALEQHAPACRIVVCDAYTAWPAKPLWPELSCYASIVGPKSALLMAHSALPQVLGSKLLSPGPIVLIGHPASRPALIQIALAQWSALGYNENLDTQRPSS